MEIARRIEEVHSKEARAKGGSATFEQLPHRDTGGVRRDDCVRGKHRLEAPVQVTLWRDLFYDRLDDQIARAQPGEIVLGVSHGDRRAPREVHESGGLRFFGPIDARPRHRVSVALLGRDVEEYHGDSRRRGERGNSAPHGARANDPQPSDSHSRPPTHTFSVTAATLDSVTRQ